jgi:hypothetical protein
MDIYTFDWEAFWIFTAIGTVCAMLDIHVIHPLAKQGGHQTELTINRFGYFIGGILFGIGWVKLDWLILIALIIGLGISLVLSIIFHFVTDSVTLMAQWIAQWLRKQKSPHIKRTTNS